MRDPHSVLGLTRGASDADIKSSFRKLAKQYHPDLNPGNADAEAKFKELTEAYEALTNPKTQPHQPQGSWNPFNDPFESTFGFSFTNIRDIEELLRQQAAAQSARAPNGHFTTQCEVTLEQIFDGCEIDMHLGGLPRHPSYRITIPKGITENQRIRVPGAGRRDNPNMPPGDLFVVLRMKEHDRFRRFGAHLVHDLRLDALDAILGTEISILGLDGRTLDVTIPPGSQFGDQIVVPNEGMPIFESTDRGNLIVACHVEIPRQLDERHIALVERLREKLPPGSDVG